MRMLALRWLAGVALAGTALSAAHAESAQSERARREAALPTCAHSMGTVAIAEPEKDWWTQYGLGSPEAVIKVLVMHSHCFNLVDRGGGMAAAERERALAAAGQLRQGSNVGKGQIKTADYVIMPDLVSKNANAGGSRIGGVIGGFIGGPVGALASGVNFSKKTADVVLTVIDVRSTEQKALEEGHASKTDVGFGGGGGVFAAGGFGVVGAESYQNTEIGQVITLAYVDAYAKIVNDLGGGALPDNAQADNVRQAVTMSRPGRLYASASERAKVVKALEPGMLLYPTGEKQGVWWHVTDEVGNDGWVSSALIENAK